MTGGPASRAPGLSALLTAMLALFDVSRAWAQPPVLPSPPTEAPASDAPVIEPTESETTAAEPTSEPPRTPADPAAVPSIAPAAAAMAAVAPDPSVSKAADDEFELSQAMQELDEVDSSLQIYGFADFTFTAFLMDEDSPWFDVYFSKYPTFAVGNINLYLSKRIAPKWSSLVEFRLLYLPNGSETVTETGDVQQTDTLVLDPHDKIETLHWGGISIERAQVEYELHELLKIRAGQWLTPYGIWNVDHGSPVLIGIRRPFVIGFMLFPKSQTGLELLGTKAIGDSALTYHLTLSNGRGPYDSYLDLDYNKGVGGRLLLDTPWLDEFKLGVSAYTGTYTKASRSFTARANQLDSRNEILEQYRELSLAADLRAARGPVRVQAEFLSQQKVYSDRARPVFRFGLTDEEPDYMSLGGWGLVGYQLPVANLMPYVLSEYLDTGWKGLPRIISVSAGVNARPTPSVTLKLSLQRGWVPDFDLLQEKPVTLVESQAAWVF